MRYEASHHDEYRVKLKGYVDRRPKIKLHHYRYIQADKPDEIGANRASVFYEL
jgi:hypothetical protein